MENFRSCIRGGGNYALMKKIKSDPIRKRLSHAAGKLFSEKSIIYIHGYSKKNEFEY
jgi:hypothetical protein